jgi:ParB-like chromosome segregation protein Spo0J
MRLTQLAANRSDVFHLPYKIVHIREGFNIREDYGDIEGYATVIIAEGVKRPLTGHKDEKDNFLVTEGHRTHKAFHVARARIEEELRKARIDEDKPRIRELNAILKERLATLPVISEPQGYTDAERTMDMLNYNDGKPFTILEEARAYQRLMTDHGMSQDEIIRRKGISLTGFQNCMMLLNEGAPFVLDCVRQGRVAASMAVELVRKVKDKTRQVELVKEALSRAKEAGKEKVTAKHLTPEVRQQVSPSKKGTTARRSTGGGGSSSSSPSLLPNPVLPSAGAPRVRELTDLVTYDVPIPAKYKMAAEVTLARISHGDWVVGVKLKYPGGKELTGMEPSLDGDTFTSRKAAEAEGLNMILDNIKAARRTATGDFTKKLQWDDLLEAVSAMIETDDEVPRDGTKDHDGTESLVPGEADADPVAHIIALRDKLKGDKRMAKKLGFPSFICLNFIADYLGGKRYEPEQFEQFFTEFVITGKQ